MSREKLMFTSLIWLLLLPLVLAGCGKEVTAQEIADNVIQNYSKIETCKMDMDMIISIKDTDDGSMPLSMDSTTRITTYADIINREMQAVVDATTDTSIIGTVEVTEEIYVVGGQWYMKMSTPGKVDQWVRTDLNEELWNSQNKLERQVGFLMSAVEITKLGEENVEGIDCYVLQVKPDMDLLFDSVLSQQKELATELGATKADLTRMFKQYAIKQWIDKDRSLLVKSDIQTSMEILPQDIGNNDQTGKINANIQLTERYYDYGEPVVVELPQEALNAPYMPSE